MAQDIGFAPVMTGKTTDCREDKSLPRRYTVIVPDVSLKKYEKGVTDYTSQSYVFG